MSKKLYVPDRLLAKKQINPVPPSIGKGFGQDKEPNKNEDDPSKIDSSVNEPEKYILFFIVYIIALLSPSSKELDIIRLYIGLLDNPATIIERRLIN